MDKDEIALGDRVQVKYNSRWRLATVIGRTIEQNPRYDLKLVGEKNVLANIEAANIKGLSPTVQEYLPPGGFYKMEGDEGKVVPILQPETKPKGPPDYG